MFIFSKQFNNNYINICIFYIFTAWLNNCVGFGNHRYFFLYMFYTTIGCLFLIVFGFEIGYNYLWLDHGDHWTETEPLEGEPVKLNLSGHIIPDVCMKIIKKI